MGTEEVAHLAGGAGSEHGLAGSVDNRGGTQAGQADPAAEARAARGRGFDRIDNSAGTEPGVDDRLPGRVPHRRRAVAVSANGGGQLQPLPVAVRRARPGQRAERAGQHAESVPGAWSAGAPPQ